MCKLPFNVDLACLASNGCSTSEGEGKFVRAFEDATMLIFVRFMYACQVLYMVKSVEMHE